MLERAVEADDPLCLLDAELRGAVFQVEGIVADRMLLVELLTALLAERADGVRDRRGLAICLGDPFDRFLVFTDLCGDC